MDAVITGASTGIGRAIALRLHAEGWRVFAGVRKAGDGEALRDAAGDDRVVPLQIDVTDADGVHRAADLQATLGPGAGLHGLVNNAGIGIGGPVEFVPLDDWRRQLEVNVIGQVAVTQAFLPMIRAGKGRIVNIGSIGGRLAAPFVGPYSASKFAMEAVTGSLRGELRKFGIWVAIIEPGTIATPIWDKAQADADAAIEALPATGSELYGRDLEAFRKTAAQLGARGIPPERVADAALHALTAKRPKARYLIDRESRIRLVANAALPVRTMDAVVARVMGIGR